MDWSTRVKMAGSRWRPERAGARRWAERAALALALMGGAAVAAAAQTSSSEGARAVALVDGWIEAMGGPDAWSAVDDIRYTVTTVWFDEEERERRRRPRFVWLDKTARGPRVRVERTESEGHYVQVWDGSGAWATLDGELLPDTAFAVEEIPYVSGDLGYWIGLPWKLKDEGVELTHVGEDPHGPGEAVRVTFGVGVGLHDQDRYWYYFDERTAPYPTEVHYIEQGHPDSDRNVSMWGEWREAPGLSYVGERLYRNDEGKRTKALIFSNIVVNAGAADWLFQRPSP